MKTLVFTNQSGIKVSLKTDLFGNNNNNLTVFSVEGRSTIPHSMKFPFVQGEYNYRDLVKFSIDNNLNLIQFDLEGNPETLNSEGFSVSFTKNGNGKAFEVSKVAASALSQTVNLTGTAPFSVVASNGTVDHPKLNWITASIAGSVLTISGTVPSAGVYTGAVAIQNNFSGGIVWVDFVVTSTVS